MYIDQTGSAASLLPRRHRRAFCSHWHTPEICRFVFQACCPLHSLPSPLPIPIPLPSPFLPSRTSSIKQEPWFTWNAKLVADLIALLHKHGKIEEAEYLFNETVSELGFKERDLCMFYCNLVESHAKHKSERGVLDSCTQLRQLISQSSSAYVKQKGYGSMVAGFCESGLPYEAESLMEEMREKGLKPSGFKFKSLVYGYGQKGFVEDMKRIIVRMEGEGLELDTVCCNMVLSSFGANNELADMYSWLKKMRNLGIDSSVRTYNSVLNYCPTIIFLLEDMERLPLTIDELLGKLEMNEVNVVMELMKSSVLDQVMKWKHSELKLDLHGMHLNSAYLIMLQWFSELKMRFGAGNDETPTEIVVVCGCGRHSSRRGESPVRDLAKEMIARMKCPLRIDRKNVGRFIAKGKVFNDWLCCENGNKFLYNRFAQTIFFMMQNKTRNLQDLKAAKSQYIIHSKGKINENLNRQILVKKINRSRPQIVNAPLNKEPSSHAVEGGDQAGGNLEELGVGIARILISIG